MNLAYDFPNSIGYLRACGSRGEALSRLRRARSDLVGETLDGLSVAIYTSSILSFSIASCLLQIVSDFKVI